MSMTLRRGTPADAAIVVEFNRRLALESEGKALDLVTLTTGVARVLADGSRGSYFVAESGGEIVGQLMITTEWSDWRDGWLWWIQSVYVRDDFRRAGVFRALFDRVVEEGKVAADVVGIRLYVEDHNTRAIATYERLGMTSAGYRVLERCPL